MWWSIKCETSRKKSRKIRLFFICYRLKLTYRKQNIIFKKKKNTNVGLAKFHLVIATVREESKKGLRPSEIRRTVLKIKYCNRAVYIIRRRAINDYIYTDENRQKKIQINRTLLWYYYNTPRPLGPSIFILFVNGYIFSQQKFKRVLIHYFIRVPTRFWNQSLVYISFNERLTL